MPNYKLIYGVSEVAHFLKVDRATVKKWTYHFSDYLSEYANPEKGKERKYILNDICVFNYVNFYWETEPDIESICIGLNRNEHNECPYNEIETEIIPLFREFNEEFNEEKNIAAGGMFGGFNKVELAESYKKTGDLLIESFLKSDDNWGMSFPIIFNYRHSTELYLKAIIEEENNIHDLTILFEKFKSIIKLEFNSTPPTWFENIIKTFNQFDPASTVFRYGEFESENEMIIDFQHIKKLMGMLSESFHLIQERRLKLRK